MFARAVEARQSGARLLVDVGRALGASVVTLDAPGAPDLRLLPDEARRLAVVLIEAAARAEAPEPAPWP